MPQKFIYSLLFILKGNWSYSFDGSEQHSGKQLWTLNGIKMGLRDAFGFAVTYINLGPIKINLREYLVTH